MKYIKNREKFLKEAKIRDVIFPRQAIEVSKVWGEKYLDYEEVTPTDKIKQGKWKLNNEDKMKVLGTFFDCNMNIVYEIFTNLNDKFATTIEQSLNLDLISNEGNKIIMKNFNVKNPTIDQIVVIYEPVFRKISVSETMAVEMIQKDENGRPVRDEAGEMIKIKKNKGDLVFTNNLVNINTFVDDFNRCFPDDRILADFSNGNISVLRSMARIDEGQKYKIDFEIFNKDIYLSISHNPKDILNMSISKFYSSCQHLYGGSYREQVLGNVFDPNSIPAFLTFETPIFWNDEKIADHLPLSRMVIRNIETFDDSQSTKIFFDRSYPDRMKVVFDEMIEKYTENKETVRDRSTVEYVFMPDIDTEDKIRSPYMDRLSLRTATMIGKNTKILYLSRIHDWSNIKISPEAKVKEIIIETTSIPENLFKINLNPDWIKFKYLEIFDLSSFDKIKTDSIAFDKCKLHPSVLSSINSINPNIKKLQIVSCDISEEINFEEFKNLEELQIIYTLNSIEELKSISGSLKIKKLAISGDIVGGSEGKKVLNDFRKKGIKIEIIGPIVK